MSILRPGHELHPNDLINRLTWPVAGVQGWWGLRVAECGAAFQPLEGRAQSGGLMAEVRSDQCSEDEGRLARQ